MTERLLQYIWQFQYYNAHELCTTQHEKVQVIFPGTYNTNQGADFLDARIRIGDAIWAGSVELHMKSSDWNTHGHSADKNYDNVILHVVWSDDLKEKLPFTTLELQHRISNVLLQRYNDFMVNRVFIPCEKHITVVPAITIISAKEKVLAERLQWRANKIETYLQQNKMHWEEAFWWLLARNFGIKINSDAFEAIARTIPLSVLAKNKTQIHTIEALLFGQANLLNENFKEAYPAMLAKEYKFLQQKYNLQKVHNAVFFLRMRPANFPTIRLAQLAMLIAQSAHIFSKIKEAKDTIEVKNLLNVTANDYWHYHYIFDEETTCRPKVLGKQMVDNILINTVVPALFAYAVYNNDDALKAKAITWLEQTAAEKNIITKGFENLGVQNKTAFDSQALLQLKNNYCDARRCLQCSIGNKILRAI